MATKAHAILGIVKLAISAELIELQQLISQQPGLKLDLILRILLTYLPETLEPNTYKPLLSYLSEARHDGSVTTPPDEHICTHDQLSHAEARERVRQLRLLPLLSDQQRQLDDDLVQAGPFTQFLICRAHRIEAETGSLLLVSQLMEPFIHHSEYIRTWAVATLLPLLRLDYEYYTSEGPTYSLEVLEAQSDSLAAIQGLLSRATRDNSGGNEIARDLRGVVGPWMYGQQSRKRRKLNDATRRKSLDTGPKATNEISTLDSQEDVGGDWEAVNDWLLDLSMRKLPHAVEAILQWGGPEDIDYGGWSSTLADSHNETLTKTRRRYAQVSLAVVYANNATSKSALEASHKAIQRTAELMQLAGLPDPTIPNNTLAQHTSDAYYESLSPTHLLHNALLRSDNPITAPNIQSLSLAQLLLSSNYILQSLGHARSCRALLELANFGSDVEQLEELRRLLHKLSASTQDGSLWEGHRHRILWLRDWSHQAQIDRHSAVKTQHGIFAKVALQVTENEMLKAMLPGTAYDFVAKVYCRQDDHPLPSDTVEKTVLDAALASYDSASNGNRNRGGVRKASDIINAFRDFFPNSDSFRQISSLLKATHAMSFYSLTLQHGVPFQPVNIRAHKDPMLLIGKILEQNPRSYTQLDNLLDIGHNLVAAGLNVASTEQKSMSKEQQGIVQPTLIAERRITGMAIEAALGEDDFDTAYSYVVNRLPQKPNPESRENFDDVDDFSWQAAYRAGCHVPTKTSWTSALRRLEQRMEVLSQALLLARTSALCDILEAWRHCEDDLNEALAEEAEAEEKWDDRGDRKIPGQFTGESSPVAQKSREPSRAAMNEEAPMGLFDVARGAAATLSKSAFPLRSPRDPAAPGAVQTVHERSLSKISAGGSDSGSGNDAEGRVRKRDMVSNMVTGGLASGIGWVIGAPPVREE